MDQDQLETRVRNLRADLTMYRVLIDAMLIAMTPNARAVLKQNFQTLSEQCIAAALGYSGGLEDATVHALQRAAGMLQDTLDRLPASPGAPAR